MMRRQLFVAAAALFLLPAPAPAQDIGAVRDPYQEALQSIAEGRNSDASAELSRAIEREPLHAGAWLELALLQCALGRADEAEALFKVIEQRFTPPPGILELIATSRARGCSAWQPPSQATVMAARGVDQNVNQGASNPSYTVINEGRPVEVLLSEEFRPRRDGYSVVAAEYRRDLTPNGSTGFVQLQARNNDTLRKYDSSTLAVGAESVWRFGRWTAGAGVSLSAVRFGGEMFQRQVQLQARLGTPLALPLNPQLNLSASLTRMRYPTLDNFDATNAELRGQLSIRRGAATASAGVTVQLDSASGARPGGDRRGWMLSLHSRRVLHGSLSGELGYTLQALNSALPYAPPLIDTVRRQRIQVARAGLSYALDRNHSLVLEARVLHNDENISIFQYDNRLLQLAWQWNGW